MPVTTSRNSEAHSFEMRAPFWMALGDSASLTSASEELGGTSTAGEQLKNPCGCRKGMSLRNQYEIYRLASSCEEATEGSIDSLPITEMPKGLKTDTMSMKPMCSTGMTGQSSSLGICVSPNTYLQIQNTVYISCRSNFQGMVNGVQDSGLWRRKYQRTMSVSSSGLSFLTHVGKPSWIRGFWLGNSPPGNISSLLYWVTQRLCFKNPALLRYFASGRANGRQFEPGTSL